MTAYKHTVNEDTYFTIEHRFQLSRSDKCYWYVEVFNGKDPASYFSGYYPTEEMAIVSGKDVCQSLIELNETGNKFPKFDITITKRPDRPSGSDVWFDVVVNGEMKVSGWTDSYEKAVTITNAFVEWELA